MKPSVPLPRQAIIGVLLLAVAAGVWFARAPISDAAASLFAEKSAKPAARRGGQRAVPVVVRPVAEGHDNVNYSGIGTARAVQHVTLYSPVAGEVLKVHTRAGDRVAAGAKIMDLDARQAKLAVEFAQSKFADVERLLARAERLRRRSVQSMAKVEDAKAALEQARVELKQATETLADHTIIAPFAGVVGLAGVEPGDRVTTTSELVTLDDRSRLTVEFEIPERYLPRLAPGKKVSGQTPGFGGRTFEGEISRIDSRVHPVRRTAIVRAAFANPDDVLRPGMSFSIDLKLTGKAYPRIPELALQFSQRGNYIWLVGDDNKVAQVPVRLVRRIGNEVLVDGGLRTGQLVVVEGVQRLRSGRDVKFTKPDVPAKTAAGPRAVN